MLRRSQSREGYEYGSVTGCGHCQLSGAAEGVAVARLKFPLSTPWSWQGKSSKLRSQLPFSSLSLPPGHFCTHIARFTPVLTCSVVHNDWRSNHGIAILSGVSACSLSLLQLETGLCCLAGIGFFPSNNSADILDTPCRSPASVSITSRSTYPEL